jgi:choice-of-anchor A domain-containing protein
MFLLSSSFVTRHLLLVFNYEVPICEEEPQTLKPTMKKTFLPTKAPTRKPTESPSFKPTKDPTPGPTKQPTSPPTDRPTENPTASPTENPTDSPTYGPTDSPTRSPTVKPKPDPTDSPTFIEEAITEPPQGGGGGNYECVWPGYLHDFTAITEGNFNSAAHTLPSKVATGGVFSNPTSITISPGGKVFYNEMGSGLWNFNGGKQQIDTLFDVSPSIDFAYYQWLARNIKDSQNGKYKVKVYDSGREGTGKGGCYTLSDLRPEESAQSVGTDTLAVFNTNDDICLETAGNGRAFGPSVLAPFSKVTLKSNYVDGIVISKEFFTNNSGSQMHGKTYKGEIECIEDEEPPLLGETRPPLGETNCDEKLANLGYGFSEAIFDPSLGNSNFGQDGSCFPKVTGMKNKPLGYDDAVSFFVGGNYEGKNGAEVEGNMVVLGNLKMTQNGPSNFVTVGYGTQVVPHNHGVAIKVGGDMSSPKRIEICRQNSRPNYPCTVVVKGNRNSYNKIAPDWMKTEGFNYLQDSNLDLSEYEEQVVNLRSKSKFWGSLPNTSGASYSKGKINCSNQDVVQVFNVPSSDLTGNGYSQYVFNENCSDKTVLMNAHGTGSISMKTKHMKWTQNGQIHDGGWKNFPSCMNSAILWNFPDADNVVIDGSDELQGSLLVTGNLEWKSGSGQSGRTMVLGNLVHNKAGSEFHSFDFKPPMPLPLDCNSLIHAPADPSPGLEAPRPVQKPTPNPTKNPTKNPTNNPTDAPVPAPTGGGGAGPPADCDTSKGCCSQDFKTCAGWGGNTKDACNPKPWGNGGQDLMWLTCGPLKGAEAQCSKQYTGNCNKNNVNDCCPGLACYKGDGTVAEKGSSQYAQCKPDKSLPVGQYPR